jgi:hypothetical protein
VLFPATVAALGALPLFFAWRSLANYFYLVPVLALAVYYASSQRDRVLDANTTALPTESTRT